MRYALVFVLMLSALVAGCGDMDTGDVRSQVSALEPIRDGGTNGYHCGPSLDKAYVCYTPRLPCCTQHPTSPLCKPQTMCLCFSAAQWFLDHGALLGKCP